MKSRVDWQVVRSDVVCIPWFGRCMYTVRSPVAFDVSDAILRRIFRVRFISIKVRRRYGDEPWFNEL